MKIAPQSHPPMPAPIDRPEQPERPEEPTNERRGNRPRRRPGSHFLDAACTAILLLLVTFGAGLLACATSGVNQGDINVVSLEDEWRLGHQLESDLDGKLKLVGNRTAHRALTQIGQGLVAQTEMARLPWEFHIVRDPTLNAFNIPGGHVYVHTGLIAAADSPSELAGVLAHEIAHGVSRHGTEQLTRTYGLSIAAGLVLGENPPLYQQLLTQVAGTGALASFSRDAEREADAYGVRTMHRAGYDPRGMASFFEELLQQRRQRPGTVQQFFATHPLTENRISAVRAQAAELPPVRGGDAAAFRQLKRSIGG